MAGFCLLMNPFYAVTLIYLCFAIVFALEHVFIQREYRSQLFRSTAGAAVFYLTAAHLTSILYLRQRRRCV